MKFFGTGVWLRRLRGVFLILVFVSAFLYIFSLNFRTPGRMDFLQRSVTDTLSPPIQFFGRLFTASEKFFTDYIWLKNLRTENESLKAQIAVLQNKLTSYQEAYVENQRLRRLLDFKKQTKVETIAAQVVVHDLTGWFQTLMVDRGSQDGVAPDMPVVNEEGVIGRVLDVSNHYCRVLLITDQGSAVDAVDQRNRVRGILCGKDAGGCVLKYVRNNLDVEEGDLVITSGKGGIFPEGLRLGVVHAVYKDPVSLFQKIDVKPLVRLSTLEEVLIMKRRRIEPIFEQQKQVSPTRYESEAKPLPITHPDTAAPAAKPPAKPKAQSAPAATLKAKPIEHHARKTPRVKHRRRAASHHRARRKFPAHLRKTGRPEPKVNRR